MVRLVVGYYGALSLYVTIVNYKKRGKGAIHICIESKESKQRFMQQNLTDSINQGPVSLEKVPTLLVCNCDLK
jgi:hypothetical protein